MYLINLIGWHSHRRIVVIISDDWGGVRVRSIEAWQRLINEGIEMNSNRFDRFDALESNDDLEPLFEILLKHKDYRGNHPLITAAVNVANPDFDKIKGDRFTRYQYEPFTKTLERYPKSNKVYDLYKKGIELNIFKPELHGREHLQVKWWLENLLSGNEMVRKAFEQEYWYLPSKYLNNAFQSSLAAAYDITSVDEVTPQKEIVADGVKLFNDLFGYNPSLFIPPAQYFHQSLEPAIAKAKFKMIDVPRLRKMPRGYGKFKTLIHYLGQKNHLGMRYLTRNAVFEPNINKNSDGVNECLTGIERAFRARVPAIISNHRAAFSGGLEVENRNKGLRALNSLLKETLKRWPDVEFMSAASLYELINGK